MSKGICPPSSVQYSKDPSSDSYYLATYVQTPSFTAIPSSNNIINADGTVNSDALNSWTDSLVQKNATPPSTISPRAPGNPAEEFAKNAAYLRSSMQSEYCYYYARYMWAMQTILMNATSTGGVVDQSLKDGAQQLNTKLNTILLVMKSLVNSRMNTLNGYYGDTSEGVNSLNSELDSARRRLEVHSNKLQRNDLSDDIQSSMIQYSIEKNSSSSNLLAVYGFLNMIAAGMLYYIYTNTK